MLFYTVFWLTVALFLYNPLFRFLFIDKAKATPIEKTVVAMLACLTAFTLCLLINVLILLWKSS